LFLLFFYLPVGTGRFDNAVFEALYLAKWYAREHVVFCLLPAFFIAGAIGVFISQASVMKYLGATANKVLAYGVASVSGTVLAVCSCTVLPMFAGIYKRGAGLGPATAFLYSGPAINILAIILTARVLGLEIGIARAVGAVVFSVVIGLLMHLFFRREEMEKVAIQASMPTPSVTRPLWKNGVFFAAMIAVLIFATWAKPVQKSGLYYAIFSVKWILTSIASIALGVILITWMKVAWWKLALAIVPVAILGLVFPTAPMIAFAAGIIGLAVITGTSGGEMGEWFDTTWGFTKQITPLLLFGVLISGALLGRPGNEGLVPSIWISNSVGGNSLASNFIAAIVGAFMYFATLTEIPILQGLIGSGMGKGPALALLLAGPALSLPSMLVLNSIMGTKKTVVYCSLVVVMATLTGMLFGAMQ
jgi:uncharacterized membrane protein YraQ (UPF0718 family)